MPRRAARQVYITKPRKSEHCYVKAVPFDPNRPHWKDIAECVKETNDEDVALSHTRNVTVETYCQNEKLVELMDRLLAQPVSALVLAKSVYVRAYHRKLLHQGRWFKIRTEQRAIRLVRSLVLRADCKRTTRPKLRHTYTLRRQRQLIFSNNSLVLAKLRRYIYAASKVLCHKHKLPQTSKVS